MPCHHFLDNYHISKKGRGSMILEMILSFLLKFIKIIISFLSLPIVAFILFILLSESCQQ